MEIFDKKEQSSKIIDRLKGEQSPSNSPLPSYMEPYHTGRFEPPTPEILRNWMTEYGLSTNDFAQIVGITPRRISGELRGESKKGLEYSAVRLFLEWAGLVNPERFTPPEDDIDFRLTVFLKRHNLNVEEFTSRHLQITPQRYYFMKKNNPDGLRKRIGVALDKAI